MSKKEINFEIKFKWWTKPALNIIYYLAKNFYISDIDGKLAYIVKNGMILGKVSK